MNSLIAIDVKYRMRQMAEDLAQGRIEILVNGRIPVIVLCEGNPGNDVYIQYCSAGVKPGQVLPTQAKAFYDKTTALVVYHMDGTVRMLPALAAELANL